MGFTSIVITHIHIVADISELLRTIGRYIYHFGTLLLPNIITIKSSYVDLYFYVPFEIDRYIIKPDITACAHQL